MIKLLRLEFNKVKRKRIWLLVCFLMVFQFAWSLWATRSYHDKSAETSWQYLLYQIPSINTLLMPILISIITSRLSDNEHKGETLKLLTTIVSPSKLYLAKFICGGVYLIFTVLGQVACMLLTSNIMHFTDQRPMMHILSLMLTTFLVNLCLLALYQGLAMVYRNQVIVLIGGLVGGFIGLFGLLFPPTLQKFCLPSYYSILDTIFPIFDLKSNSFSMRYDTLDITSLGVVILCTFILFFVGQISFSRKEF